MIVILDDILSEGGRQKVLEKYSNRRNSISETWVDNESADKQCKKLLKIANRFINIKDAAGFELWTHYNTKPGFHFDKDETLFNKTGELKFPLCTILYYPYIDNNLIGGEFVADGIQVKPITNRMIIFSPGVWHGVNEYKNERFSLIINPWLTKIEK